MITKFDGVVDKIYHLLWQPDDINQKPSCKFDIPDTILYRKNAPTFWYFTSKQGYVKRKRTKNITPDKILESFKKKNHSSGILAYFLYNLDENGKPINEIEEIYFSKKKIPQKRTSKIVYFDEKKLSSSFFF